MTIAEFLLARIAEDEALWRLAVEAEVAFTALRGAQISGHPLAAVPPPAFGRRMLAECEAKRRIIEGMAPYGPIDDINADEILPLLALPYADHPDYDEGWRA
jgi:hypothetical protein